MKTLFALAFAAGMTFAASGRAAAQEGRPLTKEEYRALSVFVEKAVLQSDQILGKASTIDAVKYARVDAATGVLDDGAPCIIYVSSIETEAGRYAYDGQTFDARFGEMRILDGRRAPLAGASIEPRFARVSPFPFNNMIANIHLSVTTRPDGFLMVLRGGVDPEDGTEEIEASFAPSGRPLFLRSTWRGSDGRVTKSFRCTAR